MKKILAIDDQMDNLITIKALLKNYMPDLEVLISQSGQQGIDIARKEQPDTILLDIIMPKMDGYEVCKKFKEDESIRHIPVIMLTAIKTDSKSRIKGLEHGADAFLSKPIDPEELLAQINVMLRIKKAEDKLRADKEILEEQVQGRTKELTATNKKLRLEITDRKKSEEALKDSENRLNIIFESAPDAYYLNDFEGIFLDGNKAAEELLGYSREELIGKNFLVVGILPVDQAEKARNVLAKNINGESTGPDEYTLIRKDGSTVWAEILTHPVVIKGEGLVLGIARDITEKKKAEEELQESYKKLQKAISGNIQLMATTVEIRDPYTAGHQRRVADLALAIATDMALPKDQIEGIYMAGVIHDVGKISIPTEILSKPGKLTELEFSLIKTHSKIGFDILKEIEFPWPIAQVVYQHHERMDGSGYPQGLSGEKILLEARIMCVADVVEAMASHRPYRAALGIDVALKEIKKNSGILYDAEVGR